ERRRAREAVADQRRREAAEDEGAFAADHHEPHLRGQRDTERGEDERRRPRERVLPRERTRERAAIDERVDLDRRLAERGHEQPEDDHRRREGGERDGEGFAGPHTLPTTPSTR